MLRSDKNKSSNFDGSQVMKNIVIFRNFQKVDFLLLENSLNTQASISACTCISLNSIVRYLCAV